jgi:hypothetical protein
VVCFGGGAVLHAPTGLDCPTIPFHTPRPFVRRHRHALGEHHRATRPLLPDSWRLLFEPSWGRLGVRGTPHPCLPLVLEGNLSPVLSCPLEQFLFRSCLEAFDCAGFVRGLWAGFLIFFETLSVDLNEKKSKGHGRGPQKTPDQFIQTASSLS